jgi:hypothetical protein
MTWWETQEMAAYVSDVELRLDEWSMSNAQMRLEQDTLDRMAGKIQKTLSQTAEPDKKVFLKQLADRIGELRLHLTERLKRDIPSS